MIRLAWTITAIKTGIPRTLQYVRILHPNTPLKIGRAHMLLDIEYNKGKITDIVKLLDEHKDTTKKEAME